MGVQYYVFTRSNPDWKDILKDSTLSGRIQEVYTWTDHLQIGVRDDDHQLEIYIRLKWAEEYRSWDQLVQDRTPVDGVDYLSKPPSKLILNK